MVISLLPVRVLRVSGNREGTVAKSCLMERCGLNVCRTLGAGTLGWICTETTVLETQQH